MSVYVSVGQSPPLIFNNVVQQLGVYSTMPLSLFYPWLFLFCPWLSLFLSKAVLFGSLAVPVLSRTVQVK